MSDTQSLKWLLIGTGDIVRKRVAAALSPNIVGICGGKDRAEAIAAEHGSPKVYTDIDAAIKDTTADAVYIATAVYRHGDEATKALKAGKHVLVEKPLGLTAADAQGIADIAKATGKTAGCAYYRRCFPRFAHLKQLIADGKLGKIVNVRTCNWSWFSPTKDDPKYWRVVKNRSGGGPLSDVGCHMFDLIVGLFDQPKTVFARCDTLANDYEVEDAATIVMTLKNGAHVSAQFGWNTKTWRHEFEVVGTEGKALWFPADAGKIVVTIGRDVQEVDLPNADNVHQPLVDDFIAAVRDGRQPICSLGDAVKTNRILDAVYRSSTSNQMISL